MANHQSTKKSIRKTIKKTEVNKSYKNMVRSCIKKIVSKIELGDIAEAKLLFPQAQSYCMKAVTKGIFHKNTMSRKISRTSQLLKKACLANK